MKRYPGVVARSTGRPCRRPRNVEYVPLWRNASCHTLARPADLAEVVVVALPLAGQQCVQRVVDVVVPLGVEAVAVGISRGDEPRIVEIGLGDQRERPRQMRGERVHLGRHLFEHVRGAVIHQRVYGIQPQPVRVVVPQPRQRAVDDIASYAVGEGSVEVQRLAPVVRAGREHGREHRRVRPGRSKVVVDGVDQHGESTSMARVDESLQPVRPAVRLVRCVPADAVVPPAVVAVECVDRQQFDEVDTEIGEMVQAVDGRVERALAA